jgi:hypothetical protein
LSYFFCLISYFLYFISYFVFYGITDGAKGRERFWKFNTSFGLINLHLLNLPMCAIEFLAARKCLNFFDLWVSLVIALCYVLFYLNVLDANGFHFYIVFTPRTKWCLVSFSSIVIMYYGIYLGWNKALVHFELNNSCA